MSAPTTPTLSVAANDDGVSVTATIGSDAGVTNQLYYQLDGAAGWTAGGTCTGPGPLVQSGLTTGLRYWFIVVSVSAIDGSNSLPSSLGFAIVRAANTAVLEQVVQSVIARISPLITAGTLSLLTRQLRYGAQQTRQDKQADVMLMDGVTYDPLNADSKSWPTEGFIAWHRRIAIYFWRRVSESAPTPIDMSLSDGVAQIIGEMTDLTRPFTNPVFYVDVEEDIPITSPDKSCDGRMLVFDIKFEHRQGDAYSQT
ncbi:MAG: hypothetical protein ABSA67_10285 [Candidatus Brocadiia bacterium]|jgi:hypothetical protein